MNDNVEEIEKIDISTDDNSDLPPTDIVAYNELRSCADLVRLHQEGILIIQPDFQREIVWKNPDQSRFIDSLIKQLPIPSLCFSLDYKTDKRLVIDGLQRMKSIVNFLTDENWILSKLDDIDDRISGKKVSQIRQEYPKIFERVQNVTLPITVLRCDYSKSSHINYLFTIFHRLNKEGTKLNNQEIRNAIFSGAFNNLLKDCNKNEKWRILIGIKEDKVYRFLKEELILRFFAFFDNYSNYKGSLNKFLNEYMLLNKNLNQSKIEEKKLLFIETVEIIFNKLSNQQILNRTSNVIVESLMIGIAKNLSFVKDLEYGVLANMFGCLLSDNSFSDENLRSNLTSKDKVLKRIETAIKVFSGQ